MKKTILTIALSFAIMGLIAQVVSGLQAPADGTMGEFTEWKKTDISFGDNTNGSIEYRIALVARKGLGCHYALEVKNTSDIKLDIRMKSNYYDKLVKRHFGDEIKETLKPGKAVAGRFIGQGCKKDKDVERTDYEHCIACDLTMSIYVSK